MASCNCGCDATSHRRSKSRSGQTDFQGLPHSLQLALIARQFSHTIVFENRRLHRSACFRRAGTDRALALVGHQEVAGSNPVAPPLLNFHGADRRRRLVTQVPAPWVGATHDMTCRGTADIVHSHVGAPLASICGCSLVSNDRWRFAVRAAGTKLQRGCSSRVG